MSDFDIEKLLKQISELEAELKTAKKYGLIWDKENTKEEVVLKCEKDIPVLVSDKSKKIVLGSNNNILIEGDNFHSLTSLNFVLKNSIDLIYIDPPYNTGHQDFAYNDRYVNDDDGYRHSKWLSFISKRLYLARDLLKPEGVIFVSIDDNEQANLKLLLDSIFGESNFLANIMVKANPRGRQSSSYFAQVHDYLLVYRRTSSAYLEGFKLDEETINARFKNIDENGRRYEEWELRKRGAASRRIDVPNLWYPIFLNKKTNSLNLERIDDNDVEILPYLSDGTDGRWRWGKDKFLKEKQSLYARKNSKGLYNVYERKYIEDKDRQLAPTIWDYQDVNTELGTEALKQTTTRNVNFDYPKPVGLIKRILQLFPNQDATVLDFFAGSGTTGQAVLELNKEDDGKRKFILCTNNENNICSEVTFPRLKTVITGKRQDGTKYSDGINSNLYYFKTDFIKDELNTEQAKYNLVEKVDALLCIAENIFEETERNDYSSHFKSGDKHLFIYNDYYNAQKFEEFKSRVLASQGEKIVYVYSSDNNVDDSLIEGMDVVLKPIPSKIYEIYKEIVEDIKRDE